jgi:hypothetical protein
MDTIRKTPLIILILTMTFTCVGIGIDWSIGRPADLFAFIGLAVGIVGGVVILYLNSEESLGFFLNRFLNPFFGKQKSYAVALPVACPEDQAFQYCDSTLHASNLRYESHPDLGKIVAMQPAKNLLGIRNSFISLGVDAYVNVEPLESGDSLIIMGAESRRSFFGRGLASWKERWDYEAKKITEGLHSILLTILDRHGIDYGESEVL